MSNSMLNPMFSDGIPDTYHDIIPTPVLFKQVGSTFCYDWIHFFIRDSDGHSDYQDALTKLYEMHSCGQAFPIKGLARCLHAAGWHCHDKGVSLFLVLTEQQGKRRRDSLGLIDGGGNTPHMVTAQDFSGFSTTNSGQVVSASPSQILLLLCWQLPLDIK